MSLVRLGGLREKVDANAGSNLGEGLVETLTEEKNRSGERGRWLLREVKLKGKVHFKKRQGANKNPG